VPDMDEIEVILRPRPFLFGIIDLEFYIRWDPENG
jgi:hypothetical protein